MTSVLIEENRLKVGAFSACSGGHFGFPSVHTEAGEGEKLEEKIFFVHAGILVLAGPCVSLGCAYPQWGTCVVPGSGLRADIGYPEPSNPDKGNEIPVTRE